MREIMFRGKRVDNGEWVYGDFYHKFEVTGIVYDYMISARDGMAYPVIPETVGQYTGLDDKNGKKIFEGDVLIFDGDKFVILWNDERCGFRMDYWMFDEEYDLSELWPASEVIGNITDNPELMEEMI